MKIDEEKLKPFYLNEYGELVYCHKTNKNLFAQRSYHWCDRIITLDEAEERRIIADDKFSDFDDTDYVLMTKEQETRVVRGYKEIYDTEEEERQKLSRFREEKRQSQLRIEEEEQAEELRLEARAFYKKKQNENFDKFGTFFDIDSKIIDTIAEFHEYKLEQKKND